MRWIFAPLNGLRAIAWEPRLSERDLASFGTIRQVAELISQDKAKVIVTCAAGLHRTGMYIYVLLRWLGYSPEAALETVQETRQNTFDEFVRLNLKPRAERVFAQLGGVALQPLINDATGADSLPDDGEEELVEDEELEEESINLGK